jgi:hypothetical protein
MTRSPSALETLIGALNKLGVEYLIGGSVASSVFGRFRATNDIDIVAALRPDQVSGLVEHIGNDFIAFEDDILGALRTGQSFNLIHRRTIDKVDIFPATTAFEWEQLKRARRIRVELFGSEIEVFVASPEDVVLAKLRWFQMGEGTSERQWSDIKGVVEIQAGKLDLEYLNHWARELGVDDLLALAFR